MRHPDQVRAASSEGSFAGSSAGLVDVPYSALAGRVVRSRLKRAMDVSIASGALLALSPFLLGIALAIRLDSPGAAIYRQQRYGHGGRVFRIYKFRTMTAAASTAAFKQAQRDDARITRLGRLLRRTNIDELPQLLNVLTGDMSLVGPRPHPMALDDAFAPRIPGLMRRYDVRPGITGWAQVNGLRGETATVEAMAARVAHDIDYAKTWSIGFDLRIIVRTLFRMKAFENAF